MGIDAATQDIHEKVMQALNAACADYHRHFPQQCENLLVTTGRAPIFIAPAVEAHLPEHALATLIEKRAWLMQQHQSRGALFDAEFAGKTFPYASIRIEDDPEDPLDEATLITLCMLRLHHEIGHLLVNGGRDASRPQHFRECVADAFMILRHIQTTGTEEDILQYHRFHTMEAVLNTEKIPYYTAAIADKIASLQKQGLVIGQMTLQETVQLAGEIAEQYHLDDKTLSRISAAFTPVRLYVDENGDKADHRSFLKVIINIMRAHQGDADIYRAGHLIISQPGSRDIIAELGEQDPPFHQMVTDLMKKEAGLILNAADAIDSRRATVQKQKTAIAP